MNVMKIKPTYIYCSCNPVFERSRRLLLLLTKTGNRIWLCGAKVYHVDLFSLGYNVCCLGASGVASSIMAVCTSGTELVFVLFYTATEFSSHTHWLDNGRCISFIVMMLEIHSVRYFFWYYCKVIMPWTKAQQMTWLTSCWRWASFHRCRK